MGDSLERGLGDLYQTAGVSALHGLLGGHDPNPGSSLCCGPAYSSAGEPVS